MSILWRGSRRYDGMRWGYARMTKEKRDPVPSHPGIVYFSHPIGRNRRMLSRAFGRRFTRLSSEIQEFTRSE